MVEEEVVNDEWRLDGCGSCVTTIKKRRQIEMRWRKRFEASMFLVYWYKIYVRLTKFPVLQDSAAASAIRCTLMQSSSVTGHVC